jgi:DNA-binding response OmpR family regulator
MRVLVAGDVRRLADDIAEDLRDQSMAVDIAYYGLDAAFKLDVNAYDVLVLDRDPPELHGDTICRMITDSGKQVMVLMLTAELTGLSLFRVLPGGL